MERNPAEALPDFHRGDGVGERADQWVRERISRLKSKDDSTDEREEALQEVLDNHAHSDMERYGMVVAHRLLRSQTEAVGRDQLEEWIRQQQVIVKGTFDNPMVQWLAQRGQNIIRPGWGDERTEDALREYYRKVIDGDLDVSDPELRAFLRKNLDWIRARVLMREPLEHESFVPSEEEQLAAELDQML